MRTLPYVGILLLTSHFCIGQIPPSARVANYDMVVTLDPEQKRLEGTTRLTWINPSADTIHELQFHLYYNAFKNDRSTWMQEDVFFMEFLGSDWYENCDWGWSLIHQMHDSRGNDLTRGFAFIHPDDDNIYDETVLRVPLTIPVMPHDSAVFEFAWTARIPKAMVRTGYNKDFYFFAQWFPKLGVYEPAGMRYAHTGTWNCHQYHADGEYYADFGEYDVHLRVPEDFVVAASGLLAEKVEHGDKTATWAYHAADVIDFTWTASPHFISVEDEWKDVQISVMMYPDHQIFFQRYKESIRNALSFMHDHVGDYPFPNLTIIDPPIHGMFVGGMEYPNLITSVSTAFLPSGFKSTETLVTHEFVHQYFMQVVATHEQEEPWMDEGISSYYEARIMDAFYGPQTSMIDLLGIRVGNLEFTRHEFFSSGHVNFEPNTLRSWEYHQGGYSMVSYNKVVLWMRTLEGLIGTDVLDAAMQAYFEKWKFRHPCGPDFIAVINEVVSARLPEKFPEGMDWFFRQVLEGTGTCDYGIASISNIPVRPDMGYLNDTSTCVFQPVDHHKTGAEYKARVIVHRLGGLIFPQEILIVFDDGRSVTEYWDGESRSKELVFEGTARIVSAEIDPARKIYLDLNFTNNSRTVSLQRVGLRYYFTACLTGVQHLLETISLFM